MLISDSDVCYYDQHLGKICATYLTQICADIYSRFAHIWPRYVLVSRPDVYLYLAQM